jgi:hypothetical protein
MLKLENRKILFAYKEVTGDDEQKRIVTFAGEVQNDELKIGFAIAQPRERYHKALGREIAVGRMEKKPMAKLYVKGLNSGKLFNDFVRELETTDGKLREFLREQHEQKLRNKKKKNEN